MDKEVLSLVKENERRMERVRAPFNPVTGEGSIGERFRLELPDFPIQVQYLPVEMHDVPMVRQLEKAGTVEAFFKNLSETDDPPTEDDRELIYEQFIRIRFAYDFPFWAFLTVLIKPKGEGDDVHFRLNRPQRKLISTYERQRKAGKPIRVVLAKSRQWGGSTATQIYMLWIQLIHKLGVNSIIVGNQRDASTEIFGMFEKMIASYPTKYLHELGEKYREKEDKLVGTLTPNIRKIPQRKCKIKIGSALNPDSARGGDSTLVHCSEVAFWKKTEGKTPEQMVRSACAGTLYKPYTMIVYESSPNGINFFSKEYDDAKAGRSMFEAVFVAWHENDDCTLPLAPDNVPFDYVPAAGSLELQFAKWLYDNRNNTNTLSDREESGKYLWYLWTLGATFEAINWYVHERSKYHDHADMASEAPSDDIEAFTYSGNKVFDLYNVNQFKAGCRAPRYIGDVYGKAGEGKDAVKNVKFSEDRQGQLWIWQQPEIDDTERVKDRYLVVVDIGGRSRKADWSVITVFDRLFMMDGGIPSVVAQWYGHIDMDLLSWKAAQIAAYYDDALLVIESNTLETKDRDRLVDGDQSMFILNEIKEVYPNLYARKQSADEIAEGKPVKYGFHTNVATKPKIIAWLIKMVREHLYVERDERCLDEYLCYEQKENGSYGAILGKHDDLLMTRAIGLWVCFKEMPTPVVVKRHRNPITHKRAISAATI